MKKVILAALAATCFAGYVSAQDGKEVPPTVQQPTIQEEYNTLWNEWIKFNNWNKDAAYSVLQDLEQKLRVEFPLDPQIQKAVDDLNTKQYAALEAKAKEWGYSSYKDVFASGDNRATELKNLQGEYQSQIHALTSAYYQEFQNRYMTACVDAMKRLMENAESMK